MSNLTKIVWREWFNASAIKQMTEQGTLPREECEIDARFEDGAGVAALVAEEVNGHDNEAFREGGELVILEPTEFAGTYRIDVEYTPTFTAYESDLD